MNEIPVRLQSVLDSSQTESDSRGYYKIKRVLGQKQVGGKTEYLVQIRGEPSQQAFWVKANSLDHRARKNVAIRPPPELS